VISSQTGLPKTGESRRKVKKYNFMTNEELFTQRNYKFFSKHKESGQMKAGSLYFRGAEGNVIYRGRIRLCHEDGPEVQNNLVNRWELLSFSDEDMAKYMDENISDAKISTVIDNLHVACDLVKNDSRINTETKIIAEKNNDEVHISRGIYISNEGRFQLSTEQILNLVNEINGFGNISIEEKNNKIKNIIEKSPLSYPDWLYQ
jgi:hypothetical protein